MLFLFLLFLLFCYTSNPAILLSWILCYFLHYFYWGKKKKKNHFASTLQGIHKASWVASHKSWPFFLTPLQGQLHSRRFKQPFTQPTLHSYTCLGLLDIATTIHNNQWSPSIIISTVLPYPIFSSQWENIFLFYTLMWVLIVCLISFVNVHKKSIVLYWCTHCQGH